MLSHHWSDGQQADAVDQRIYDLGQPDATQPQRRFRRPSYLPSRHKKSSSGSSLLPLQDLPPVIDSPAIGASPYIRSQDSVYSVGSTTSAAAMLDIDRPRSRKERTFVGGKCAACELSLEHKLSGEKVLQFSCGHLAHETCLYEYLKDEEEPECPECDAPLALDSTRGGSILDLNKLSSMVRSIASAPGEMTPVPPGMPSPKVWDGSPNPERINDAKENQIQRMEKLVSPSPGHSRNNSNGSSTALTDDEPVEPRKHDYDLSTMEAKLTNLELTRDIPRPKVTIRSEFPTLTRSSQQQSLTCLVTVEVPNARQKTRSQKHIQSAPPSPRALDAVATDLKSRVDDWHGLDVDQFGPLRLHANLKVGRDGINWQKLDCFLFSELLICVREKKATHHASMGPKPKFQLKGSILIRKHLKEVQPSSDGLVLTLNLIVATLPTFRLKFANREQLDIWKLALSQLDLATPALFKQQEDSDTSGTEDEGHRPSSIGSSNHSATKTATTAATDYADQDLGPTPEIHIPTDIVVVVPLSSSMQGLKIKLLKDAVRFLITNLGERDRMGLVTFGLNGGAVPLVGMATKDWYGWRDVYRSIKPLGQKSLRADPVEGADVALDVLSQRRDANPVSSIFLISDSSTQDTESMDFVVKRAHANKASIYTFGLGQTHKPDHLIELSTRTNASYQYVKDWMMLRECVAGCQGSLQSISHVSAKLKLKIPEGSTAKFVKVSGALHTTKKSSGREAEATIGDLRFGDRRDVLVQLTVEPDAALSQEAPPDHWDSIVSGLTTLGGSLEDQESRPVSVEELPLIQADLSYGDFAQEGAVAHLTHPSLLTITMLPASTTKSKRMSKASAPPQITSHPSIVQRRMEMLTSDMLTRALTLVSKNQHESAHRLLTETRTILQGLGKGSLPPLPPPPAMGSPGQSRSSSKPRDTRGSPKLSPPSAKESEDLKASPKMPQTPSGRGTPKLPAEDGKSSSRSLPLDMGPVLPRATGPNVDPVILHALDSDIESCLEFIEHPAVFSHDARKAALQTIGIISSQRAYTFRTETESLWATRVGGIRRMCDISNNWTMVGNDTVTEE